MKTTTLLEKFKDLRNQIVESILEHLTNAKAKEVELTGTSIVVGQIDDQFSQTIDNVTNKGLIIAISYGEQETWNFEDVSTENLLAVLTKLENKEFEVYEESAEQGS